ncbi:MAG: AsmA family protein [Bryobacteraceae bacterium]|nr:AsmA family protein [Bryobacteraceae bacterium]
MRRLWIFLGLGAALLALAVLALPWLVNADSFRPLLKSELEKSLRRPVELGPLSLSVFPLAIVARDVVIGEDPAFGQARPFARAQSLAVRAGFFSVLKGNVKVDSLRITQPLVELIQDKSGRWNVDSLTSKDSSSAPLQLTELRIDGGRVALTTPGHPRAEYENIDLLLRDYGSGGKSPLSVTAHLPGKDTGDIAFTGTLAGNSDLAGELTLRDCALTAIESAAGRPLFGQAKVDGQVSGKAQVSNSAQAWSAEGNVDLRSKALGNVATVFRANAQGTLTRVEQLQMKVGQLALTLTGTIDQGRLALKLAAADAPITELAKLAAGFGVAFAPGMQVTGQAGTNLEISGTTQVPAFAGQVRVTSLEMRGGDLKQPVRTPRLVLDLTPGELHTQPFEVVTGNTKLSGSFSLADYASDRPQLDASVKIPPANLADLVDIAQAYGASAARGVKATGTAAVEAKVFGSLAKGAALQYRGTGNIQSATLSSPALTKPVTIRASKLRFEGDSAGLEGLDATIGSTTLTGRVATRADRVDFALNADQLDVNELRTLFTPSEAKGKPSQAVLGGTLAVGTLKMDRLVLTNVRANVATADGQIRLDPLVANVYGGTHNGVIVVDQRQAQPVYTFDSKLERIDSGQLLEAVSSLKQFIAGPLSAQMKFTVSPKPNEDLIKSLDGTLGVRFTEGKLYSMNLLGELGKLAQFLKISPEKFTNFLALTGDLKLANGTANTDNLRFDLDNATVNVGGVMNLVDQSINLKLRTLLNRKLAEEVGGSRIGGYLTAAVTGANGDMTIPSLVTGTFAKPRFAPDTASIAKLKLQSVVPALTKDPNAVVDAIKGNKEGVRGLIDIFKGKKKSEP